MWVRYEPRRGPVLNQSGATIASAAARAFSRCSSTIKAAVGGFCVGRSGRVQLGSETFLKTQIRRVRAKQSVGGFWSTPKNPQRTRFFFLHTSVNVRCCSPPPCISAADLDARQKGKSARQSADAIKGLFCVHENRRGAASRGGAG